MSLNFINFWQKRYLTNLLILILLSGSTLAYGLERGPITIVGGTSIYKADPQSACEYSINTYRGTPFFPVPGPNDADILSIWATGYPASGPVTSYGCNARILRLGIIMDILDASWSYPVCNVGDFVGGITSETICSIPDNIPDKGSNLGHPPTCNGIGNPINAPTGNKYAEEMGVS